MLILNITNVLQYLNKINMVRPNKRWAKWVKDVSNEDLDAVCTYYTVNRVVGREYLSLLSKEQIQIIKKEQEQGGNKK